MTDTQLIAWLRFFLGDITIAIVSDENLQTLLDTVQVQYPSASECEIKYKFALTTLGWLIRAEAKGSAGTGNAGGEVKERSEKRGKSEITVKYSTSGTTSGTATGWAKVLEDLKADPSSIGCNPIVTSTSTSTTNSGKVIIGGKGTPTYGFCSPSRSHLNQFLD